MSITRCPSCGTTLFITTEPGNGYQRDATFEATANPFGDAPTMAGSWSKTVPHSKLEPKDILTSVLDSGVTFFFTGIAGGGLAYIGGLNPWSVGASVGFLGAAFRYFDGMGIARSLTQAIEEWTADKPEPTKLSETTQRTVIRAETTDPNGNWRFADIDADPDALIEFAKDILSGKTFAERTATGNGLTQAQFGAMRDQFIEAGWARWNHPNRKQQGASLTRKGVALIRSIAESPSPNTSNTVLQQPQQHAVARSTKERM